MIDMHIHILPGVDDGPSSLEESLKMIHMVYEDGVRHIVATPHRNHPLEFKGEEHISDVYALLKRETYKLYPDLKLDLGCELYIRQGYLEIVENEKHHITLGGSKTILVEYDRSVSIDYILDSIHELKIRGYRPVLAHIEMYPALIKNISVLSELRAQGAYIQITASSLIGKQGKATSETLKRAIDMGYIDFVASDGHSSTRRRPILSKAERYIAGKWGKDLADKLFVENQTNMLANFEITPNPIFAAKKGKTSIKLSFIAGICAVALLGAAAVWTHNEIAIAKKLEQTVQTVNQKIEKKEVYKSEPSEIVVEPTEETDSKETQQNTIANIETSNLATKPTKKEETIKTEIKTADVITADYTTKLQGYQDSYESQLSGIVDKIIEVDETVSDQEEKNAIITKYLDEISALEATVDNQVSHALYDMQNELEDIDADVSPVKQLREAYYTIKDQKQAEYIDKIK